MGLLDKIIRFLTRTGTWGVTVALANVAIHVGGSWIKLGDLSTIDYPTIIAFGAGLVQNLHSFWLEAASPEGTAVMSHSTANSYLRTW